MLKLIRRAVSTDVEAINKLGEQLHDNFTNLYHIESEINSNIAIVFVSVENNIVNGYLYALDLIDNIDLLSIFVDSKYRTKHIGTNLLNRLIKYAKDKTITLEVSESNIVAINMYRNLGFSTVSKRQNYYKDDNALVMKWGKNER